ncbi:MAG: OmpA family protein [Pseudomonadota bacterium]
MNTTPPFDDDRTVMMPRQAAVVTPMSGNTLPPGTRLGEFELTGLIGECSFGIVYKEVLDKAAKALQSDKLTNFKFDEGYVDPRNGAASQLSQPRAESVREYLVQNHHVAGERLKAIGNCGKELLNEKNPMSPENRRVTIKTITEWIFQATHASAFMTHCYEP